MDLRKAKLRVNFQPSEMLCLFMSRLTRHSDEAPIE